MRLAKLYELIIKIGMDQDPRGRDIAEKELAKAKKTYSELKENERKDFDAESLLNPYADTRLLCGGKDKQVKNILVGIDVDTSELLLADRLSEEKKIDLVLSHHPQGIAFAGFYDVMNMQADIFEKFGVSASIAEGLTLARKQQVKRRVLPANHLRVSDAAKLLGLNFMCVHTPADNCVASYLQKFLEMRMPDTLGDALRILKTIPEYKFASQNKSGPSILLGDEKRKCGKIFVDMTGGTEGSQEILPKLAASGVSTIIVMHLSEEHYKRIQNENINVIIAGHISSDNLGLNLLLDSVEKKEKLSIIEFSGFRRVSR
ncbi:MAG: NGG1p interacting factor NIF3 [Candidatus Omnitrophica bacterium CG11_big_fil_rev_8_21_14_0_20_42_13]|uniref:NGG1p interacting factor NIF3 n=1 Tax=Candidatus Ghiorseimicrobium undicola TaxID=1974746 RepID=A0A2H0M102_9BACT|nr:MAG: NGG1p interacting factor NIF3 [Candidatus Omnitrophica bacterium CG11_big_fil_rev_8_21_14_0_20_42_13]